MEAAVVLELPEAGSEAFEPAGRPTAPSTAAGRTTGRCLSRVCQVECGERDIFQEHCGSDEHFDGLQAFGLSCPDLFLESIKEMTKNS